jgi:hypothetical protein
LGKFVESLLNIPLSQMPPVTLAAGQSLPQVVSSSSSVVDWIPSQDMAKALDLLPALPELASSQTAYKDGGAWIADHIGDNPTPISVWASVRFKTERTVILGGSCAFLAITAVMLVGILPIWLAFLLLIVLIGGVSSIVYAGFQALPYIDAKSNALERVRTTKRAARIAVTAVDLLQAEFQNKLAPLAALKRQYQELPSRLQKSIEREGRQTGDLLSANQTAIQRIDAEENRTIRQIKDQLQSNTAQLGRRKAELDGQEQADVALALRPIREQSIQLEMQSRRIRDAGVRGIGAVMTSRLEGAGIRTALDVLRLNVRSVPGIGEQKAEILLYWANGVKHDAEQRAPTNLAATTRSQISDRYRTMRQKLDSQIQAYQNSADSERQSAIDKCAQQRRSFVNQRSQLEARLGDVKTAAQKQFAQERNRLENEYKNEHKRATDLQKQYETRMAGLRQAVLHEHLEVRKAENEAKRYDSLNFPEYLRRIVDIRSTLWAAKRKRP